MAARNFEGTLISFGTSSWAVKMLSIGKGVGSRGSINTSESDTDTYHTFIPEALVDPGEITFTHHFDPDEPAPVAAAPETITITWPTVAGETSGATYAGNGYITSSEVTGEMNGKLVCTTTIKKSGEWTFTDAGTD